MGTRPRGPCSALDRCSGPMLPLEAIAMPVSLAWSTSVALLRLAIGLDQRLHQFGYTFRRERDRHRARAGDLRRHAEARDYFL